MSKLLFKCGDDWTPDLLSEIWDAIEICARKLKTTYYKEQIEIVSARQMLDAYTSVGMPIYYKHWSFGKEFVQNEKEYKSGRMGLAYEMVINSDPCIAYLMEENDALMQTLVLAHASVGHSAVFKNNYLFQEHTDASSIIDYLNFAKGYIKKCEEKYGVELVEEVVDACHSLQSYGVDKYKKPKKLSPSQEEQRANERFERELNEYDAVWEKVGAKQKAKLNSKEKSFKKVGVLDEPQENILYFLEKNAPHLPAWKREIIRIVRKLAEYFEPQRKTKVLNEGYATFCHHFILNEMYDEGYLDAGSMIEMYASHAGVLRQRDLSQFNPYKLGFSIFTDIKRLCEGGEWIKDRWIPVTDEDRLYFHNLIGKDWATEINYAMENFKDETFILQYLSPKVARDLQLFAINDPHLYSEELTVTEIANQSGFQVLRQKLASQFATENLSPDIQVVSVDQKGSRKLVLEHFPKNEKPLAREDAQLVTYYVAYLWEYDVDLKTIEYGDNPQPHSITLSASGKYSLPETIKESSH